MFVPSGKKSAVGDVWGISHFYMIYTEQLSLYNNTLRGQVPSSLGNLLRLSILNVDRNDLTGSVPSQVCNLETSGSLVSVIADCEQSGIVCTCCDACR